MLCLRARHWVCACVCVCGGGACLHAVNACVSGPIHGGGSHLSKSENVPAHWVCWVHRTIACGWPPPEVIGVGKALFSSLRFKECARQILSPKIISFYWCSKLTRGGVSRAKSECSCCQARGVLWSGDRSLPRENFTASFLGERLCRDARKVREADLPEFTLFDKDSQFNPPVWNI